MEIQPASTSTNEAESASSGNFTAKLASAIFTTADEETRHRLLLQYQQETTEITHDTLEEKMDIEAKKKAP